MEKGILKITHTAKGKDYTIHYTKKGKSKSVKADFINIKDEEENKYNNKECEFKRENGQVIKIIIGDEEFKRSPQQAVNRNNQGDDRGLNNKPPDSFNIESTKVPHDTRNIKISAKDIDNFNLKLNKFARFEENDNKFEFFKKGKKNIEYQIKNDFNEKDIKKMTQITDSYKKLGYEIKEMTFEPDWRLIVGLGHPSVYETSITLHHIYGIPYIPASGIKGAVRNYIINEYFELKNDGEKEKYKNSSEKKALDDEGFCCIFGSPKDSKIGEHIGSIIFFDAFPTKAPEINVDIMNPHYQPYYSDKNSKTPPADYHSPVPIHFLVVENTPFKFVVGVKKKNNKTIDKGVFNGEKIIDVINEWLEKALKEHGLGAKTAAGYGYFE